MTTTVLAVLLFMACFAALFSFINAWALSNDLDYAEEFLMYLRSEIDGRTLSEEAFAALEDEIDAINTLRCGDAI